MQLYFVRHGIAEDFAEGKTDAQRALTREGIARTKMTAHALHQAGVKPRRLYSSPLLRAQETAQIIAEEIGVKVVVRKALAPGFDVEAVTNLIAGLKPEDRVMFVGHEPDLSSVISRIIGGGEIIMKKGSVARVDVVMREPLHGALIWLLPTKLFER
jgi:phosphohistidine phosphatase